MRQREELKKAKELGVGYSSSSLFKLEASLRSKYAEKNKEIEKALKDFIAKKNEAESIRSEFEAAVRHELRHAAYRVDKNTTLLTDSEKSEYKAYEENLKASGKVRPTEELSAEKRLSEQDLKRLKAGLDRVKYFTDIRLALRVNVTTKTTQPEKYDRFKQILDDFSVQERKLYKLYAAEVERGVKKLCDYLAENPQELKKLVLTVEEGALKIGPLNVSTSYKIRSLMGGKSEFANKVRDALVKTDVQQHLKNKVNKRVCDHFNKTEQSKKNLQCIKAYLKKLYDFAVGKRPPGEIYDFLFSEAVLKTLCGYKGDLVEEVAMVMSSNRATRAALKIEYPVTPYYFRSVLDKDQPSKTILDEPEGSQLPADWSEWEKAQNNPKDKDYWMEIHHIVANTQGGSDTIYNGIVLTRGNHFVLHCTDSLARSYLLGKSPLTANETPLPSLVSKARNLFARLGLT